MHKYREWLDPGGVVARRLGRLRSTLEGFAARLREAVADALGRALGGVVRDAVQAALDGLAPPAPDTPFAPAWSHRSPPEPVGQPEEDGDPDDFWPEEAEDWDEGPEPYPEDPPAREISRKWPLALAAGLRAAAWVLPRRSGPRRWLAASALALLVGGAGFLSPALAAAGLTLVGAAHQLGLLTAAVQTLLP